MVAHLFSSADLLGHQQYPVDAARYLTRGRVDSLSLKRMEKRDFYTLDALRQRNSEWLRPWDSTPPCPQAIQEFSTYVREQLRAARKGNSLPLMIVADGEAIGQIFVADIVRGAAWSAAIGYWIAEEWAGSGIMTAAVARTIDICFEQLGLHRVEICVRPINQRSLGVVAKLGLRSEGIRRSYLHINGAWADHECFAILNEERPAGGMVAALISGGGIIRPS